MKKTLICLLFAGSSLLTNLEAQTDANPAKTRAIELRDALKVLSENKDAEPAAWDAVSAKIDAYPEEFGVIPSTSNNLALLRKYQLSLTKRLFDQSRYRALLDQLANDPVPAVAKMAVEQLEVVKRVEDLKSAPADLKFTAADGSAVDLAALRGKVVAVDFWASWCRECTPATKRLATVYRELHDKGLEVIGVNLDEDQAVMEAFAKKQGLTWPNFFDGKKWDNQIGRRYGISSIPTLWVFDKKGMLVSTKEPEDLSAEVKRLLSEP